jgi:hypothetical protein
MKKIIRILLMLLIINIVFIGNAFAEKSPSFVLSSLSDTVTTGKDFTLELSGVDVKDLFAFESILSYPTDKVKMVKATSILDGFAVAPIFNGNQATYAFTKVGKKSGEKGKVKLVQFTFNAKALKKITFKLDSVKAVDSKLKNITYTKNGSLEILLKSPSDNISYEEAIATIVKAAKLAPASKIKLKFVGKLAEWEKPYIQTAVDKKFITVKNNTFTVSAKFTRSDLAVIALKAFGQKESKAAPKFKDIKLIPSASKGFVTKAVELKVLFVFSDNTFRPSLNVTYDGIDKVITGLLKLKK